MPLKWINELKELNSKEKNLSTLEKIEEAFMSSDYADCKKSRINAFILFKVFKKILSL